MKVYNFLIFTTFLLVVSLVVLIGCKYDVAQPSYDKPVAAHTTVTITSIDPPREALPGANNITIYGGDFTGAIDTSIAYNGVFFNNVNADVIECSSTSIKVRRPNLTGDSITVNVATTKALIEAKSGLYKIDPVKERYGSFFDNFQLNTVTIDNTENLFVIKGVTPFTVYKITPAGVKTVVGIAARAPLDAKIGPDGNLYYMGNGISGAKAVGMINMQTATDSLWYNGTKYLACFDFDNNGYIYAGGSKTNLLVIRPNKSVRQETSLYATDTIFAIRVFGTNPQNLYVAAGTATGHAIWVSSLADTGNVGGKTLFLDLSTTAYAYNPIRSISFSADGSKLYLGFDSPDPILVVDVATKNSDILYKGIIPNYCKHFCFGNKLYMISGKASPAVNWDVYRVDVGTTGAPYY
jgi:WD40 repeat protein